MDAPWWDRGWPMIEPSTYHVEVAIEASWTVHGGTMDTPWTRHDDLTEAPWVLHGWSTVAPSTGHGGTRDTLSKHHTDTMHHGGIMDLLWTHDE